MRSSRSSSRSPVLPFLFAAGLILPLALAAAGAAAAAEGPIPVSPGSTGRAAVVEARCPTFQWAGIPGAGGYELAVFQVSGEGAEPALVTRATVPGDARGFTPSSEDCLERGRRYAWSVAASASAGEELRWSRPYLFEVGAAPSLDEVEQAIATLERYREHQVDASPSPAASDGAAAGVLERHVGGSGRAPRRALHPRAPLGAESSLEGALTSPTSGVVRVASAATPALGNPSLSVGANVALGANSNLFKNNEVFLWDDSIIGNTALGRNALASATGDASNNTAVGRDALRYATGGLASYHGSYNTAVGDGALRSNIGGYSNAAAGYGALRSNTEGHRNTASGFEALRGNTTGDYNTANGNRALFYNTSGEDNTASGVSALLANTIASFNTASGSYALRTNVTGHSNTASGVQALLNNTSGSRNTAVGRNAGLHATTGNDNIFIGSGAYSVEGETNTIRIGGTVVGFDASQQHRTFINGIHGITTASFSAIPVLIDNAGQLGTASSSRATKQDIQDLGPLADRLLALRPVAFRYKQHAATDPDTPLQFGLIAEEVAEVFPELVVFDEEGKPETIKYHLLSSLLLGEMQKQQAENQRQQAELQRLRARLDSVEATMRTPGKPDGEHGSSR